MKQPFEKRLTELKTEFESGQKMLAQLEERRVNLRDSLLRISGAIQVLEEELGNCNGENGALTKQENKGKEVVKKTKATVQ
jgi:septal ring factor EnvC (AmiA/AmiB activator)